jgi:hypothetical protein
MADGGCAGDIPHPATVFFGSSLGEFFVSEHLCSGVAVMCKGSTIGIALVAMLVFAAATQAGMYIDFEAPAYATGALTPAEGWGSVASGEVIDAANTGVLPILAGAQSAHVGDNTSWNLADVHTAGFTTDTTITYLEYVSPSAPSASFGLFTDGTDNSLLGAGAHRPILIGVNSGDATAGTYCIEVQSPSGWPIAIDGIGNSANPLRLQFSNTIHFGTQTYDISVKDLDTNSVYSATGLQFHVPMSLATANATGNIGLFSWGGSGSAAVFDNIGINQSAPVPEPSALLLLSLGVASLLCYVWRKRK